MKLDSALIWRGPKRVPGRFEVPMSMGTPTKQASSPSAVGWAGSRMKVAGAPKRGISLPPSGWLNFFAIHAFPFFGSRTANSGHLRLSESAGRKAIATLPASQGPALAGPVSGSGAVRPVLRREDPLPGQRVGNDPVEIVELRHPAEFLPCQVRIRHHRHR